MKSTSEIVDFLAKQGIRATAQDDNVNRAVMIATDKPVPDNIKESLEMLRPAGIVFHYSIKVNLKMEIPRVLYDWARQTSKAMKE